MSSQTDNVQALPVVDVGEEDDLPEVLIGQAKHWTSLGLAEFWAYRHLMYFFVWRDLKVRYRQTILGVAWAILQPLFTMVVFTVFFGRIAQVGSDGLPYPIFSYAALVPWTFFANALNQTSNSLIANSEMLKKIYFPRLVLPVANVLAGVVDFALAMIILMGLMLVYGIVPTANSLWIIPLLLLAFLTSLGVGLWLSALNVQFRDVRYAIPFITQAWLIATPIAYPSSLVSEVWRPLFGLNPMAGVVEGFRWALLGTDTAPGPIIIVSTLVAIAMVVTGTFYFRRVERVFADVI